MLEGIQAVAESDVDGVLYAHVQTSNVPGYTVEMTQELIDEPNSRPRASTDFGSGATTARSGQVVAFGEDIGYVSSLANCNDTGGYGYWPPGPNCPQDQADDGGGHSPAYGFVADGHALYGPYESAGVLARSGWQTRDYGASEREGGCGTPGERTCVLADEYDLAKGVDASVPQGPDIGADVTTQSGNPVTADDGYYYEDWYYAGAPSGGAQLDERNGHDNGDGRGYHYRLTVEGDSGCTDETCTCPERSFVRGSTRSPSI